MIPQAMSPRTFQRGVATGGLRVVFDSPDSWSLSSDFPMDCGLIMMIRWLPPIQLQVMASAKGAHGAAWRSRMHQLSVTAVNNQKTSMLLGPILAYEV